jgi:hypothetical protein
MTDPQVFGLAGSKRDMECLLPCLSECFLVSTDYIVMRNCATALASIARENHPCTNDGIVCLKQLVENLHTRLLETLDANEKLTGSSADDDSTNESEMDIHNALCFCLRRFAILSKQVDVMQLLHGNTESSIKQTFAIFTRLTVIFQKELQARSIKVDSERNSIIPDIWMTRGKKKHALLVSAVSECMQFMLCTIAYLVCVEIQEAKDPASLPTSRTDAVLQMRDALVRICSMSFDQFINTAESDVYSSMHIKYSLVIQEMAGRIAGDVRSLFPIQWSDAQSPILRKLSLAKESLLVAGFERRLNQVSLLIRCQICLCHRLS